jgi:sporulation protein YabP
MAHEENQKLPAKPHSLTLEGRNLLSVSGVEDVESFDENEIVMLTSQGDLIVRGSGLHIGKISLDVGELKVAGLITDLSYEEQAPAGGFWSRLFG